MQVHPNRPNAAQTKHRSHMELRSFNRFRANG